MACNDKDPATGLRQAGGTFVQGYDLRLLVPCLRRTAQIDQLAGEPSTPAMLLAAADEIERLRNQVDVAKTIVNAGVGLMTKEQVGEWRGVRSFLEQESCDYDPF